LRPQPDAACDWRRKLVLQIELAVEIAFDLIAGNAYLKVVPGACRCRRIANPFDRGAPAFLELPEHEIVLERIGADGEVVAVGLKIEQNAAALIDAAGDALEA